ALPLRKFFEAVAGVWRKRWYDDLGHDLIFPDCRGQRPQKIILRLVYSGFVRGAGVDLRIEQKSHHGQLGRWIGMGQAAANSAAVSDREMGNMGHRLAQDREALADKRRGLKHIVAC